MLTDGSMNFIREVLQSTYMTQLQKMDQDNLKAYWDSFERIFDKYDEQDVADAVEWIISNDEWFPTHARIKKVIDDQDKARHLKANVYMYIAPAPRARIDMSVINGIREKIKQGEYECKISNKVRKYARKLFPDINDELIRRNYCLLLHYCEKGIDLPDGGHVNLYMTKTGEIVERIAVTIHEEKANRNAAKQKNFSRVSEI